MSSNLVYEGVGTGGVLEELSSPQAEDTEQHQQHAPVPASGYSLPYLGGNGVSELVGFWGKVRGGV